MKKKIHAGIRPEVIQLVETAVKQIAERPHETVFVTIKRAKSKLYKMDPTDRQNHLLRYIVRHGFVSFEETLGMDWRFLGGLFTRGLLKWAYVTDKGYGVVEGEREEAKHYGDGKELSAKSG